MTESNSRDALIKIKEPFGAHDELIREGLHGWLQQILESKMTEAFRCRCQAATSRTIVSRSGNRRLRHWLDRTLNSISAMFIQLPCMDVW